MLESNAKSLSNLLSSPDRYAQALNLTLEEVIKRKEVHHQASQNLHVKLQSNKLSGKEKHAMMCQHRFIYGKHPFVCSKCWSYWPVCVCSLLRNNKDDPTPKQQQQQQQLPQMDIIVWMHHREWGVTSNTGCILAQTLPNCKLLMKGLPQHDDELEPLLQNNVNNDDTCLAVVLWPNHDYTPTKKSTVSTTQQQQQQQTESKSTITIDTVRDNIKQDQYQKIIVIAVDGTWRNARRMVKRLPSKVKRLDLPMGVIDSLPGRRKRVNNDLHDGEEEGGGSSSILSPLRTRGQDGSTTTATEINNNGQRYPTNKKENSDVKDDTSNDGRCVCTAEAVIGALLELEMISPFKGEHILNAVKTKVDLVCRYRGKVLQ